MGKVLRLEDVEIGVFAEKGQDIREEFRWYALLRIRKRAAGIQVVGSLIE